MYEYTCVIEFVVIIKKIMICSQQLVGKKKRWLNVEINVRYVIKFSQPS